MNEDTKKFPQDHLFPRVSLAETRSQLFRIWQENSEHFPYDPASAAQQVTRVYMDVVDMWDRPTVTHAFLRELTGKIAREMRDRQVTGQIRERVSRDLTADRLVDAIHMVWVYDCDNASYGPGKMALRYIQRFRDAHLEAENGSEHTPLMAILNSRDFENQVTKMLEEKMKELRDLVIGVVESNT